MEEVCRASDEAICDLQVDWDRIKHQIAQNKYALNRTTQLYLETHSGRFVVEDYLNSLDQNLKNFLQEIAQFQAAVETNYPEKASNINGPLNEFVKPDQLSSDEWKKTLGFFLINS